MILLALRQRQNKHRRDRGGQKEALFQCIIVATTLLITPEIKYKTESLIWF